MEDDSAAFRSCIQQLYSPSAPVPQVDQSQSAVAQVLHELSAAVVSQANSTSDGSTVNLTLSNTAHNGALSRGLALHLGEIVKRRGIEALGGVDTRILTETNRWVSQQLMLSHVYHHHDFSFGFAQGMPHYPMYFPDIGDSCEFRPSSYIPDVRD